MKQKLLFCFLLCFALFGVAFAQERTVSGKVKDPETGEGVPGVSVYVKGTSTGTTTDVNGDYKITVPNGATLVFQGVGYANAEVVVGGQSVIDFTLVLDTKQLDQVVVSAIGLEQNRDELASAVSQVKGNSLVQSGETNVLTGLQGKASGVLITRSGGDPGAGAYIQIRGQSTITGSVQPLIVVDGIPISNSSLGQGTDGTQQQSRLSDINPEDIASMEILKGASAAVLWGTRAANGVIVITTKKAKNSQGKVNISYKSTYSLDEVNKVPDLQKTWGQGLNGRFAFNNSSSFGDKISDRTGGADTPTGTAYLLLPDGTRRYAVANGTAANVHGGKNSKEVYDHGKDVFRTGYFWENSVQISAGTDKVSFLASIANLSQKGIIKNNSDYDRTSARINMEYRFNKIIRLSTNFNYIFTKSNRIQQGSNLGGIFLGGLRTSPDFDNSVSTGTYVNAAGISSFNRHVSYRNGLGASTNPGYDNPLWTIDNNRSNTKVNRLLGNVELGIDPLSWLSLIGRFGVDYYTDKRGDYIAPLSAINQNGTNTRQTLSEGQTNIDLIARATKKVNDKLSGTFLIGFNYNNRTFDNIGGTIQSYILPNAPSTIIENAVPANRTVFDSYSTIRTAAVYGQLSLSALDMFFFEATARLESASTFGSQTKSTFIYPSTSLAWQFTQLDFLKDNSILSFGKLRVAYGQVGVQPGTYITTTDYIAGSYGEGWGPVLDAGGYGGSYLRSNVKGNAFLKPERKEEIEFGTDLRFLNDRISLGVTYFSNKTTDAILGTEPAFSSGFTSLIGNVASLENKGFEVDLGANVLKIGDFKWDININWTRIRNEVTSLAGTESLFLAGFTGGSSRAVVGQPVGVLWGGTWARNTDGTLDLDEYGFPQSSGVEGVIGNPNPDWRGGLGMTFSYKSLSLYVLFDHQQGGQMWNGTRGALVNFGTAAETGGEVTLTQDTKRTGGIVIPTGTTLRGTLTDFGGGQVLLEQNWWRGLGSGFGPVAEQFVEDATNTRLREVTLSYNLRTEGFRKFTKLQSIDFSVTGRNLILWTDYKGIDPDTNLTGVTNGRGLDYFQNPNTRSILFTIKINY